MRLLAMRLLLLLLLEGGGINVGVLLHGLHSRWQHDKIGVLWLESSLRMLLLLLKLRLLLQTDLLLDLLAVVLLD